MVTAPGKQVDLRAQMKLLELLQVADRGGIVPGGKDQRLAMPTGEVA